MPDNKNPINLLGVAWSVQKSTFDIYCLLPRTRRDIWLLRASIEALVDTELVGPLLYLQHRGAGGHAQGQGGGAGGGHGAVVTVVRTVVPGIINCVLVLILVVLVVLAVVRAV